jgi:hypothetical protein
MTSTESGDPGSERFRVEARLEAAGLLRPLLRTAGSLESVDGTEGQPEEARTRQAPGRAARPGTSSRMEHGDEAW